MEPNMVKNDYVLSLQEKENGRYTNVYHIGSDIPPVKIGENYDGDEFYIIVQGDKPYLISHIVHHGYDALRVKSFQLPIANEDLKIDTEGDIDD
jgi:hypothetical protein